THIPTNPVTTPFLFLAARARHLSHHQVLDLHEDQHDGPHPQLYVYTASLDRRAAGHAPPGIATRAGRRQFSRASTTGSTCTPPRHDRPPGRARREPATPGRFPLPLRLRAAA